jgi:hypothetical protein
LPRRSRRTREAARTAVTASPWHGAKQCKWPRDHRGYGGHGGHGVAVLAGGHSEESGTSSGRFPDGAGGSQPPHQGWRPGWGRAKTTRDSHKAINLRLVNVILYDLEYFLLQISELGQADRCNLCRMARAPPSLCSPNFAPYVGSGEDFFPGGWPVRGPCDFLACRSDSILVGRPSESADTSNDTELEKLKKRLQFVMYCIDCFVS